MNKSRAIHYGLRVVTLGAALLAAVSSVSAQAGRQIYLSPPDLSRYPQITVYFEATERDGSSITDLVQDQVSLREDDLGLDLVDFQALAPGIQLVTAFNISPPFAIQDVSGNSRFDFIKEGLLNWVNQPLDSSPDDLSLLSNDGMELTHLDSREDFSTALAAYSPDLRETEANFSVLARAIEIASDRVTQPGMKKVVLFISSQPTAEAASSLESLLSQASENQVQVYTLLVSSPAFYSSSGAVQLQNLSSATGGQFLPFSGEEPLVDLGLLFGPLRSTYMIRYQSQIVTPGIHTLELSVATSLGESLGQREFSLDVQPPNPVFVSPPRSITRQPLDNEAGEPEQRGYWPDSVALDVLVEFPDKHPRGLEELVFRVDGEVMDRKTAPPFDQFVWDLSEYQSSATHRLSLEAVDIMGLSRVSLQTPVEVLVEVPSPGLGAIIAENALALGGLGVILLLGVSLFWLIAREKIRPAGDAAGGTRKKKRDGSRPKTILGRIIPARIKADPSRKDLPGAPKKPSRLIPINDLARQLFHQPILITDPEVILGSAPGEGRIFINHQSILADHARISEIPGGKHILVDFGSPAGTWINYEQIASTKAKTLIDGDIIHIGEAGFRYQLLESIIPEPTKQETSE